MPHDHLQRQTECPHRATFFPFGHALQVESNDARALEIARSTFGFWPAPATPGPAVRIRLLLDPAVTTAPPWPPATYRGTGNVIALACGGSFAFTDLEDRYGQAHFSEAEVRDPEHFRWTFLYALSYYPLHHSFYTPVHCSCVVKDGRGYCLNGPSGAGKTSLAYHCGRNGFGVLAEDMVFAERTGPPVLRGSAHAFHLTADSVRLFPELVQYPVTLARNGKDCLVVPAQDQGIRWVPECAPGGVVLLDRGRPAGLDRLPPEQVVARLYGDLQVDRPEVMDLHRQTYERLAACGAYRLGYSTLDEGMELLKQL